MDEDEVVWRLLDWLLRNLTPGDVAGIVLAILAVAAVAIAVAGLVLLRFRRHPRLRRAILRARAEHAASGAEAEIIELRLHLRDELEAARRAVESLDDAGRLAGDLPMLLGRLEQTADRLDRSLGALESSVDEWTTPRELAPVRRRVREAIGAARDIRGAALAALDVTRAGEIQALTREIEREVTWVQDGVEAMGGLLEPGSPRQARERRRRG